MDHDGCDGVRIDPLLFQFLRQKAWAARRVIDAIGDPVQRKPLIVQILLVAQRGKGVINGRTTEALVFQLLPDLMNTPVSPRKPAQGDGEPLGRRPD